MSPSLRAKILTYLVLIHLVLGVIAFFVLARNRFMLLAVEVLFAVSITLGVLLVRSFFVPLRMIRTGAELIREGDFTAHFREVGQPEMDELMRIYNRMIDRLREERLRLREQHTFLDKVLMASPAGVLTLDFDGRVALSNPSAERLLGAPSREILERSLEEIDSSLARELLSIERGRAKVVGLPGRRRLKCSRAEFYDRGFPRTFFVMEELTEELRASEKTAYEKLIRVITHEVNNSVAAVTSLLDSVQNYAGQIRPEDREDFRSALTVTISRMDHLNAFMKGFAEVVRLPTPDLRPCDVKALLNDILLLLRPELDRRRIVCAWETAESVPPIRMDKNQIEQVVINVLKNAMEAIGEDGRITVHLSTERGLPYLVIADTGCGIPADAQPNLFTPFFSTKRDGRGLGLTVVQEILGRHGFEFSLEGRPEGGAEFRIGLG